MYRLIALAPLVIATLITASIGTAAMPTGAGTVLLDAGDLVLDVSTNPATVVHMGGPHQQLSGDVAALCSYLADA